MNQTMSNEKPLAHASRMLVIGLACGAWLMLATNFVNAATLAAVQQTTKLEKLPTAAPHAPPVRYQLAIAVPQVETPEPAGECESSSECICQSGSSCGQTDASAQCITQFSEDIAKFQQLRKQLSSEVHRTLAEIEQLVDHAPRGSTPMVGAIVVQNPFAEIQTASCTMAVCQGGKQSCESEECGACATALADSAFRLRIAELLARAEGANTAGCCAEGCCTESCCPESICPESNCPESGCTETCCPGADTESKNIAKVGCACDACPAAQTANGQCDSGASLAVAYTLRGDVLNWHAAPQTNQAVGCPSGVCPAGTCSAGTCTAGNCPAVASQVEECPAGNCPACRQNDAASTDSCPPNSQQWTVAPATQNELPDPYHQDLPAANQPVLLPPAFPNVQQQYATPVVGHPLPPVRPYASFQPIQPNSNMPRLYAPSQLATAPNVQPPFNQPPVNQPSTNRNRPLPNVYAPAARYAMVDAPPGFVHEHSQGHELTVRGLRSAASELDQMAANLEEIAQYKAADRLRDAAQELRESARELLDK